MRARLGNPLLLSFTELALLGVFLVGAFFSSHISESGKIRKNMESELVAQRQIVEELKERIKLLEKYSKFVASLQQLLQVLEDALATKIEMAVNEERQPETNFVFEEYQRRIDEYNAFLQKLIAMLGSPEDELLETIKVLLDDAKENRDNIQELRNRVKQTDDYRSIIDALARTLDLPAEGMVDEVQKYKRLLDELVKVLKVPQDEIILACHSLMHNRVEPELLGLKGKLDRVVFVFDRSLSMQVNTGRWEHACNILITWLKCLKMKECCVIIFSDGIDVYPEDVYPNKYFLAMERPEDRADNIMSFQKWLKSKPPEGLTNTYKALEKALSYSGVDSIVLFSDGIPQAENRSKDVDEDLVEKIYGLCGSKKVPINTVGLGDYFQQDCGRFLMNLAEMTGGSFLGR